MFARIPLFFCSLLFITISLTAPLAVSAKGHSTVNFTQAELQRLKGHYSTKFGYLFIKAHKKFASVTVDGKFIRLIKKTDGRIYPQYKFLGLFPIKLGDMSFALRTRKGKKQVVMYSKKERRSRIVGQQFASKPIPQNWKNKLGHYKAKRIHGKAKINTIRLGILNNVLVAYVNNMHYPYPLLATSETSLYSPSAGHNSKQDIKISTKSSNKLLLEYDQNTLELTRTKI